METGRRISSTNGQTIKDAIKLRVKKIKSKKGQSKSRSGSGHAHRLIELAGILCTEKRHSGIDF